MDRKEYVEALRRERAAVAFRGGASAAKHLADIDAELARFEPKPAKRGKPEQR